MQLVATFSFFLCKGLMHSADVSGRRQLDLFVVSRVELLAFITKGAQASLPGFSGFGFLRLACGTAVKSVCISISVSLPVRVRDEPVECLPWTRRTDVCRYLPCPEMYVSGADSRWLTPQESDFCLIFGIPSWLMPLRDRSGQSSQPLWQGTR